MTPDQFRDTIIARNALAKQHRKSAQQFGISVVPVPLILPLSIQWHIQQGRA